MPAFSRQETKSLALKIKQRRARTQAKNGHPDMKLKHPAWVRDAQAENPNYVVMDKEIKEQCLKAQKRVETFTRKLHEK